MLPAWLPVIVVVPVVGAFTPVCTEVGALMLVPIGAAPACVPCTDAIGIGPPEVNGLVMYPAAPAPIGPPIPPCSCDIPVATSKPVCTAHFSRGFKLAYAEPPAVNTPGPKEPVFNADKIFASVIPICEAAVAASIPPCINVDTSAA